MPDRSFSFDGAINQDVCWQCKTSDNRLILIFGSVAEFGLMKLVDAADAFARRVAGRVQSRRLDLGMSKLALARAAGLDQRAVAFVENCTRVPSIATLFRIAFALGISVAELVKEE